MRRTTGRWLLIGVGAGVVAFVFKSLAILAWMELTTNVLLRYGPFVGVVGGTLIFAFAHGVNEVFPAALVTGLIAGEVFRRSGSVWPGVVVHAVVNLPTVPALVLAGAA